MKVRDIFKCLIVLLCLISVPLASADTNTDDSTKELNSELQKAVENYNSVVVNKDSSLSDVNKCTDQIDLILNKINELGMDVDFKQTSEVHVNNKGVTLPANISAEIKPYMLSQSYHFSCNNSTVLAEVWKTNITVAEFLEKVYPGSLEILPKESVSLYENTPMTWPTSQEGKPSYKQKASSISSNNDDISKSTIYYECNHYVHETVYSGSANFYAYTQMVLPTPYTRVPYIGVGSYIYYEGGTEPFGSSFSSDYNTFEQTATGNAGLPPGQNGFYTQGSHYVIWPVVCVPPYANVWTETGYIYIG